MAKSSIPYAGATSGDTARGEIRRILQTFGCESIGFMDNFTDHSVLLVFEHRGRRVEMSVSARGWMEIFLKANPYTSRMRLTMDAYHAKVLNQGLVAVNSVMRDWVKGQITAIECGMISFEEVFLPYMIDNSGRRLIDVMRERELLPPPSDSV